MKNLSQIESLLIVGNFLDKVYYRWKVEPLMAFLRTWTVSDSFEAVKLLSQNLKTAKKNLEPVTKWESEHRDPKFYLDLSGQWTSYLQI